ncbi:MAG: Glutamine--fructose-6-phosphate aminotransferase [isomerizing] [Anaerolineales bacterium]|nr:Glutamine--fructose-6-phosphate aminotransferase [isomerizing] [Anaerolineales bacterium]
MCGIVGYVGGRFAAPILLDGLKRLEYRGYDSAGIAVLTPEHQISIHKREGKLNQLIQGFNGDTPAGYLGVGHTRWATHGAPTTPNAHPHTDCSGTIAVVHNGIIENYASLREELMAAGHEFRSETDTEVIAHLLEAAYADTARTEEDFVTAVRLALRQVTGAYAIAGFTQDHPNLIVGARLFSPLVAGIGQGENFLASDIPAILRETRRSLLIEDGEIVAVRRNGIEIIDLDGRPVEREPFLVSWDAEAAEKGGFPHFVLKEIYEQPEALQATLRGRVDAAASGKLQVALSELGDVDLSEIDRIYIVACGTSYYAGLVGKLAIEQWARLPVEVAIASEFRYGTPLLDENTLVILITQSGETADTLAGFRLAEEAGATTIALTNVMGSTITRGTDAVLYLQVGPEIGVVATKSFTAQLVLLNLLALHLAQLRGSMDESAIDAVLRSLRQVPKQAAFLLELDEQTAELARAYSDCRSFFFFGRGFGYPAALEGALKLKEISYIHAEGYPAGELKHGPIAMLDPTIPVVAIVTQSETYDKVMSNIQEVRAREAEVIAVATEGDTEIEKYANHVIYVPGTDEALSPILNVVPLQLLAYHMAVTLGCDVDQPRNLAKSVTVE